MAFCPDALLRTVYCRCATLCHIELPCIQDSILRASHEVEGGFLHGRSTGMMGLAAMHTPPSTHLRDAYNGPRCKLTAETEVGKQALIGTLQPISCGLPTMNTMVILTLTLMHAQTMYCCTSLSQTSTSAFHTATGAHL